MRTPSALDLENVKPSNGYQMNALVSRNHPTDANLSGFQSAFGEIVPGVPETQAQRAANEAGNLGGQMTGEQQRLHTLIQQFETEYGQGTVLEMLELIRNDDVERLQQIGPGQADIDSAPIYDQYQDLRTGRR